MPRVLPCARPVDRVGGMWTSLLPALHQKAASMRHLPGKEDVYRARWQDIQSPTQAKRSLHKNRHWIQTFIKPAIDVVSQLDPDDPSKPIIEELRNRVQAQEAQVLHTHNPSCNLHIRCTQISNLKAQASAAGRQVDEHTTTLQACATAHMCCCCWSSHTRPQAAEPSGLVQGAVREVGRP